MSSLRIIVTVLVVAACRGDSAPSSAPSPAPNPSPAAPTQPAPKAGTTGFAVFDKAFAGTTKFWQTGDNLQLVVLDAGKPAELLCRDYQPRIEAIGQLMIDRGKTGHVVTCAADPDHKDRTLCRQPGIAAGEPTLEIVYKNVFENGVVLGIKTYADGTDMVAPNVIFERKLDEHCSDENAAAKTR
jgi:hypothetical protein